MDLIVCHFASKPQPEQHSAANFEDFIPQQPSRQNIFEFYNDSDGLSQTSCLNRVDSLINRQHFRLAGHEVEVIFRKSD